MIRRSTWIVLAIFLLAVGFVYYWNNREPDTPEPAPLVEEQPSLLFEIPEDVAVTGMRVESAEGELLEIQRVDGEADWALIEPQHDDTDSEAVQSAVNQLRNLTVSTSLETGTELQVVGLDTPAYTLALTLSDGQQRKLFIGDETITGTSYYARLQDGSPVVLRKFDVDNIVSMINSPPVLPTATPEVIPTASPEP